MRPRSDLLHVSLWLALAGYPSLAAAESTDPTADWPPVNPEQLDQMRGGFTTASGLEVSLGIERLVAINGEVVAHTRIDLAELNHMSAEQAQQTRAALSSVKLIQNGSDNIYQVAASPTTLGGTVIQNSLDNQLIRTETVISASVNSLAIMKTLNFQGSLGDALLRAAGPH